MPLQLGHVTWPKLQPAELHTFPLPLHLKHACRLVAMTPLPLQVLHVTYPKLQPAELHTLPDPRHFTHAWPDLQSGPFQPSMQEEHVGGAHLALQLHELGATQVPWTHAGLHTGVWQLEPLHPLTHWLQLVPVQ